MNVLNRNRWDLKLEVSTISTPNLALFASFARNTLLVIRISRAKNAKHAKNHTA